MTVSHDDTMEKNTEQMTKDETATEKGDPAAKADAAEQDALNTTTEGADTETLALQKLKQELETVIKEKTELNDRFMRAAAEFDNYKKRQDRQWADFKKYANESLIKELLSVVDNLDRALCAVDGGDSQTRGLCDGISMTIKEILKVFENFGVQQLDSVGKPFDPNYHQAVARQASDNVKENTVLEEYQKGYMIHDRLLRPAMVVVSSGKEENKT